ncbi:hypothetical protein O9993_07085 [Vibrio lentus]|nr:hypothetical protein [Vibrio lentus]
MKQPAVEQIFSELNSAISLFARYARLNAIPEVRHQWTRTNSSVPFDRVRSSWLRRRSVIRNMPRSGNRHQPGSKPFLDFSITTDESLAKPSQFATKLCESYSLSCS